MVLTSLIALVLSLLSIPLGMEWLRPDFLLLVLLFWSLFSPHKTSILASFGWGLAKDILGMGWIGQTALSYAIITYLAVKLSHRISIFPLHQQAASVGLLLGLHQLMMLWTGALIGKTPPHLWLYWIPSLLGVVLWPWMYGMLRAYVRRFSVQ